jgi:hypothetical protein
MLIYKNTVYREISSAKYRQAAQFAPAQDPDLPGIDLTQLNHDVVKLAKQMIQKCDPKHSTVRPYCVYSAEGRPVGAFFNYVEAFKNAYMWLERKYLLGREAKVRRSVKHVFVR